MPLPGFRLDHTETIIRLYRGDALVTMGCELTLPAREGARMADGTTQITGNREPVNPGDATDVPAVPARAAQLADADAALSDATAAVPEQSREETR
ncbi:hypothetical protein Snas_3092 [Stackebrandtia nassauensis DSM 44728]|uniref:Uncharacterized protein n=2 Tax=Stackebrandtia TaxID=283810 RepID=D3QAI0_STANL|nr:hypothetical protein Snas_3092 [Stackebrandtia nassauensis DSM 44728]